MKINLINTTNFGYNKEYHEHVQNRLNSRSNNALSSKYAQLDATANALEDEIVALEKKGAKYTKTEKYETMCDTLKTWRHDIAFYTAQYFTDLAYPDELIEQYSKELEGDLYSPRNTWRREICEKIRTYSFVYSKTNLPFEPKKQEKPIIIGLEGKMPPKAPFNQPQNQQNNSINSPKDSQGQTKELAVKYIPNAKSPKGFCDVYAMDNIKEKMQSEVLDYVFNPELKIQDEIEYGITPKTSFIFFGPPGCGKTHLAKALASESKLDMYSIDISKLGSSYINQTANNLQTVFDTVIAQAKATKKPVILFLDEVDSVAIKRDKQNDSSENAKATTTILKCIESAKENDVIVIATTNKFDNLDDAFKDRMEHIYFGLFNEDQIEVLITSLLSKKAKASNLIEDKEALKRIAKKLVGYSNRTINDIINSASMIAKNNQRSPITESAIEKAIQDGSWEKIDESKYKKEPQETKQKTIIGFGG